MLSVLIFLPLVFSLICFFIKKQRTVSICALIFSTIYFLSSLSLLFLFDPSVESLQLVEKINWVPALGIQYFIGVDGLSFWFVILTAFLNPLCVLASWKLIQEKASSFYACLFLMNTSIMGTFLAIDACLFYVFFESSLIPLYFIIGIWGGKERLYAAFKFFIYTAFGSLFLLTAIVALMQLTSTALPSGAMSASILDFYQLKLSFIKGDWFCTQNLLFICFFLAFAIKLPLIPFHTWLPLAHVEAPAPGSAVLAGIILKMGAYGFFRFILPLFPESVAFFAPGICVLAGLAIIYGALMALAQTNMKKLVAYSSVSHMAYVLLGLFSLNIYGLTGAFYQTLSHAISSVGLFLLVGMLYERTHTLDIKRYGGLAQKMPLLTIAFIIISLSAVALPSTGGFISEFFVLLGAFKTSNWLALSLAIPAVIMGAVYMFYLIHRIFFGTLSEFSQKISKLSKREIFILSPLVLLVFIMGIFPNLFLQYSSKSLSHLNNNKNNYQLSIESPLNKNYETVGVNHHE